MYKETLFDNVLLHVLVSGDYTLFNVSALTLLL